MFKPLVKVIVLFFIFTRLSIVLIKNINWEKMSQGGMSMISTKFVILVKPYYLKVVTSR